tara:strand:- start:42951 stop:43952 length:1002 start_codon:yes stop_codon:yes gene_type:complete
MRTEVIKIVDPKQESELVKYAANKLKRGQIVAFPTETVYGLGADLFNDTAIKKIYRAKNRPSDNPLIVHISDLTQLKIVVDKIPKSAKKLMEKFWPGPLSIVFNRHPDLDSSALTGLDTVVVRMPDHAVARALITHLGSPIVAPSANTSGKVSPTRAEHVLEDMDGQIPLILDGGPIEYGLESTVIDCTQKQPVILRPGSITLEMIQELLPNVRNVEAGDKAVSPGMKYRHYATEAPIILYRGSTKDTAAALIKHTNDHKTAILYHTAKLTESDLIIRLPANPFEAGPEIFNLLRTIDRQSVDKIVIQGYSYEDMGHAIMNRLEKAASDIFDV